VPSERKADMGDEVGVTSIKHVASEMRKKVELAPESETTVLGEGVLRERGESKESVELHKTADILLTNIDSLNTRSS
jgi:hypothetical protein